MNRNILNGIVFFAAFGLAAILVSLSEKSSVGSDAQGLRMNPNIVDVTNNQDASHPRPEVRDASGGVTPAKAYQRIASTSLIADAVLPHLVATERIIMVTESHRRNHPKAFQTEHAATFPYNGRLEDIVPFQPDLILVSNATADVSRIERARELGYAIVDLGPMIGVRSLRRHIELLGDVVQQPERAQRLWQQWSGRFERIADDVTQRPRAVYVSAYNGVLYGGTAGSSYHDVLQAAGFEDVAAGVFPGQGWPQLSVEWLLRTQPDVVLTTDRGRAALDTLPGMQQLVAFQNPGGVITAPAALLGDPGLLMLDAAELVHQRYFHRTEQKNVINAVGTNE